MSSFKETWASLEFIAIHIVMFYLSHIYGSFLYLILSGNCSFLEPSCPAEYLSGHLSPLCVYYSIWDGWFLDCMNLYNICQISRKSDNGYTVSVSRLAMKYLVIRLWEFCVVWCDRSLQKSHGIVCTNWLIDIYSINNTSDCVILHFDVWRGPGVYILFKLSS